MAYLDEQGVSRLWEKVKSYSDKNTGGAAGFSVVSASLQSNHSSLDASGSTLRKWGNMVFGVLTGTAVATIAANSTLMTLPANYRPVASYYENILLNDGSINILFVRTDGQVRNVVALGGGNGFRATVCFPAANSDT